MSGRSILQEGPELSEGSGSLARGSGEYTKGIEEPAGRIAGAGPADWVFH